MKNRVVGMLVLLCIVVQGAWAQTWKEVSKETLVSSITNNAYLKLTEDIELSSYLNINGVTVIIDLNGHKLSRNLSEHNSEGHVIYVQGVSTLTLTSSNGYGYIEGGKANNGGAINMTHGNTVRATSITFHNNSAAQHAGAIWNNGTFKATDCVFENNSANDVGAIYNAVQTEDAVTYAGTATLTGCTFTGNVGTTGAGALANAVGATVMTIDRCSITDNTAGCDGGAGIWNGGTLKMKGAITVKDNTNVSSVASNVYLKNGKVITVTGSLAGSTIGVDMESTTGTFTNGYSSYDHGSSSLFTADRSIMMDVGQNGGEAELSSWYPATTLTYIERSWNSKDKQVVSTVKSLTGSVVGYEDVPTEGQYKEVTTANGSWFGLGGYSSGPEYYVVRGSKELETIVVQGKDVHLILCDNALLRLTGGLKLEGDNKLSIHCQSYGDSMGKLKVTNSYSNAAGIGSAQHNGQEMKVGQLVIHGGHIEAKGGTYGAGIGSCARIEGNKGRLCNRVDIYGGYVEAAGGEHGAGIGGGSGYDYNGVNGGDFYLYDGTVVARGGCYGAGVGGGGSYNSTLVFHSRCNGGWGGKIVIHGGTLTADGGENAAGIGSGNIYDADACISNTGGTITIDGGTVIATGGDNGAGIGGGYNAGGPELTITGGTVTAKGRVDAAGIGGGYDGYGGVIKISGGTVTALGGEGGAGIGGGNGGGTRGSRGGNVTITGGTVIAKAGEQGDEGNRAIGPGQEARTDYWENPDNIYGTLTISNKMMVGAGNNGSVERLVDYDERMNACWYRSYAEISPCTHSGTFFTSSSGNTPNDTHATHCQHCTTYYPGEKHTFVDGQCTVCGQETSFDWTGLRLLPAPGSYTVTAGYDNNFGATSEGYKYLFDGIYTEENYDKGFSYPKWCVMKFNSGAATFGNKPCYVEFNTAEPVIPKIYALVTGNDSYQYIGRNPQTWNLKAKLKKNDGWTTIATITEDRVLQDVDCTTYAFSINNDANNAYKYFCFEIFANRGADTMQFSELQLWVEDGVALVDNIDNTSIISNHQDETTDVILAGRKLWKNGDWNTLCLPFSLTAEQLAASPLAGATIKTLVSSGFNSTNGTLSLNFTADENNLTAIEAGKPYIVKWNATTPNYIENPVFNNVTITNSTPQAVPAEPNALVTFEGSYNPRAYTKSNPSVLYLAAGNSLYYPNSALTINACRAVFRLNGITAGDLTNARLYYGEESTGISELANWTIPRYDNSSDNGQIVQWFTLDGRCLSGKPTTKGIYLRRGQKVVVK